MDESAVVPFQTNEKTFKTKGSHSVQMLATYSEKGKKQQYMQYPSLELLHQFKLFTKEVHGVPTYCEFYSH